MWNYRRVTYLDYSLGTEERYFEIRTVYYDSKTEKPSSWSDSPAIISSLNAKGLEEELKKFKLAFTKPILDLDSWKKIGDTLKVYEDNGDTNQISQ